jgi:hypothetical protein
MSGSLNVFNERRCNSTVAMVTLDGKMYCNAHYRTLISTCNFEGCNKQRDTNILCHDKKWYCTKHRLCDSIFINKVKGIFDDNLNEDIIERICKTHLKNNTYTI